MKLIATDMDGTLLDQNGEISKENAEALQAASAHGIDIVIATGRTYEAANRPLASAGLSYPVISMNGAVTYKNRQEIQRSAPITESSCERILTVHHAAGSYIELFTSQGIFAPSREAYMSVVVGMLQTAHPELTTAAAEQYAERRLEDENFQFADDFFSVLDYEDLDVYKMLAFSSEASVLERMKYELRGDNELALTSSGMGNLELNHVRAQKGFALQEFALGRGIPLEDVMAIGDNFNDLNMLQMAGRSVAMGNAVPEVKEASGFSTKTNTEHGVAHAVHEMLHELKTKSS